MSIHFDIIIIGAGLTGQTAALAAAEAGLTAALVDGRKVTDVPDDGRASALAASSMRMLTRLGVDVLDRVQPFEDMLITEGLSDSPWRMHFDSQDHGEPTAFMIENGKLYAALLSAVQSREKITLISPARVSDWAMAATGASVTLDSGDVLTGDLIVAADGRNSATRKAAGISVDRKVYDQSALVTTIAHEHPHDGLALQRFLPGGPLAVLPLTGNRCQIVWSDKTAAIAAAMRLGDTAFLGLLTERVGDYLGDITLAAPRQSYPLSLQTAQTFFGTRLALIGDAAHVIHPLAGQGLNLGLRDVAALFNGVSEAQSNGQDIGFAGLLDYERWRGVDVRSMGLMTDGLSRLFGAKSPLAGHARRAGLSALNNNEIAKRFFMQDAAGEMGDLPALMRR